MTLRLGVNIDHVATIRNARGGKHPSPLRAAVCAQQSGADGITAHLREDRRHISEQDIIDLKEHIKLPLNLEIAATDEMIKIALDSQPNAVCIVPEKRQEITTEGGLDVVALKNNLTDIVTECHNKSIKVSLFIEPTNKQVEVAKATGADIIELHTGPYSHTKAHSEERAEELARIRQTAKFADVLGLEVHAGHGLTYENVMDIAAIETLKELNIGHFLIGESVFIGMEQAIKYMRIKMQQARENKA